MVKEIKAKTGQTVTDVKLAVKNLEKLVEAAALLIVSVFSGWYSYQHQYQTVNQKVLLIAAVVIGLRGGLEFLRYLTNKK